MGDGVPGSRSTERRMRFHYDFWGHASTGRLGLIFPWRSSDPATSLPSLIYDRWRSLFPRFDP